MRPLGLLWQHRCTRGANQLHLTSTRPRPASVRPYRASKRASCVAHSSAAVSDPFNGDPALREALDDSFDLIQEMLEHVCKHMVAESAVSYVTLKAADQTPESLVRQAVEERLTKFNQMTLHTIHSLLMSDDVKKDPRTAKLLTLMKTEILKQTTSILPENVQNLESLVSEKDDDKRRAILGGLDAEQLPSVALTAAQIISDMEESVAIADVPLLCRVVLTRDEVLMQLEAARGKEAAAEARVGRRAVPRPTASLVKYLVALGDGVQRRGQIFSALTEGCKAPKENPPPKSKAGGWKVAGAHGESGAGGLLEVVRPGGLMAALDMMRHELEVNPPKDVPSTEPVLRRLADIKLDTLHVITSIRDGKLAHLSE